MCTYANITVYVYTPPYENEVDLGSTQTGGIQIQIEMEMQRHRHKAQKGME